MRIAAFVLAVLALSAIASADKIEPSIYLQSGDYVKVIVKADESALPLIASASVEYENFTGGFYSANISRSNLVFLESSAAVKRVWLERKSQPLLDISAPLIGANQTWPYYNGSGVKVCVIDTGMNSSHPALFGRVVAEKDFITDDLDSNSTQDGANHGTHVAGIVASNNSTYKGVAFGSLILNAKVFSNYDGENWSAVDSDVMAGIDWCIAQGAHVLTLSLGGADSNNDGSDALSQKLDYAVDQGKIIIVAAGNSGTSSFSILSPGLSHKAITVGSSQTGKSGTTRNAISGFSSRGPTKDGRIKPDIAAPGEPITSLNNGGGFSTFSGTSMAAPHIAGIAALALQARSNLTPEEFKALLMNTADGREKNNSYGAGVVNVSRLLGKINYTVSSSVGNYSRAHNIFVPDGSSELRATLYWPENYSYHNNLDLLLLDPSGMQQNASLSVNNTDEKIIFSNPSAGYWKVIVNGTYVNGTQPYAIAASAAPSSQLFFFSASASGTTYHGINVTNTTIEIGIDWVGNATVNASLYNYSSIVSVLPENKTRLNFSLSGGTGLWTLKIMPNQTFSYSATSNNKILNQLANDATKINITDIINGTYLNKSSVIHSVILDRRVQTAQQCTYNLNNQKSNFTYTFDIGHGFANEDLSEDSNEINVTCIDDNGVSSFSSTKFFVDTIFPSITNISDSNGKTLNRNYTFINATVNETNPFRCLLEWDGTTEVMSSSGASCFINKSSSEGFHSYKIYANDSASNTVFIARNVTFDLTAPQANAMFSGGAGNAFSPNGDGLYETITVNVTASEVVNFSTTFILAENGSKVDRFNAKSNTLSLRSTWDGACNSQYDYCSGTAPDGTYSMQINMTDRVGNVNVTNISVIIDTVPLNVSFASPTPSNNSMLTGGNLAFINVTVSKAPSSIFLEWNGTSETMNGSSLNRFKAKTKLADGNYTFRVYVNDSFGNINTTERRWIFVNVTRNITSVIKNLNETLLAGNVTLGLLNSTGSGADASRLLSFENYTLRFNVSRIFVEAAEFPGGAVNSSAAINITRNMTSEQNISTAFNSSGGVMDNYVWIDFNDLLPPGNFTAKIIFPRAYALYFYLNGTKESPDITRVTDACNAAASNKPCYNLSSSSSALFLPSFSGGAGGNDTAAPSLSMTSPSGTTYSSSSISLAYTASDNAAVDRCFYSLNGAANITLSSCAGATITAAQGSNTLKLYANDSSGNLNQTNVTFTYTPPSSSSSSSGSGSGGGGVTTVKNATANQTKNETVNLAVNTTAQPAGNATEISQMNQTAPVNTTPTGQVAASPSVNIAYLALILAAAVAAGLYMRGAKKRRSRK